MENNLPLLAHLDQASKTNSGLIYTWRKWGRNGWYHLRLQEVDSGYECSFTFF